MLRIIAGDLLMALGDSDPDVTHYLDRETGDVIPIFSGMFDPEDPEYVNEDELMENPRYATIEPISSHEAFRWMEQFAASVADAESRARLCSALDQRRPFRGFKDVLLAYPAEREAWFEFQEARMLEAAQDWLRSEGIAAELRPRVLPHPQESSPHGSP